MSFQLFDTSALEKGLDACSVRQAVISENMANVSTPGYLSKTVLFDEYMNKVGHSIEAAERDTGRAKLVEPTGPTVIETGKVDIVTEMSNLAKNQILYTAYADRITKHYADLQWIIQNAGR